MVLKRSPSRIEMGVLAAGFAIGVPQIQELDSATMRHFCFARTRHYCFAATSLSYTICIMLTIRVAMYPLDFGDGHCP
jgi:hypothetical protein